MKMINRYTAVCVGLLTVIFLITGCKKQLDINQDPNFPTLAQGTPSLVFPVGVLATTGKIGGDIAIMGGMWSEYFTQAALAQQYTDADSYNISNTDVFDVLPWDILWSSGLINYQYVVTQADTLKDWNFFLMGTVMKAYTTGVMADLWDQMPYTEALQGASNLNPKFDDGYSIYTSLIASIDDALGKDFTASTVTAPGTQDLIFGGTMSSWIAFANTLKLKLYLRMINAHPDVAQAGITAMWTAGAPFLTASTGGASVANFSDAPGLDNPMYEQNIRSLNTAVNIRASTTFTSWLVANNDPRLTYFDGPVVPPATSVISINQGDFRNANPTTDSIYKLANVWAESPTDPVDFISVAESYFLQAEADFRYNGGTNAKSLYEAGVTAAFAATGNDASTFIAPGGAYAWGAEKENGVTLDPIQQIIRQKWASEAFGCHGIEGFFDHNRTGYPVISTVYSDQPGYVPGQLVIAKNTVLQPATTYPQRLVFPYDETSRNTNAPAPVPMTTKVWWAK